MESNPPPPSERSCKHDDVDSRSQQVEVKTTFLKESLSAQESDPKGKLQKDKEEIEKFWNNIRRKKPFSERNHCQVYINNTTRVLWLEITSSFKEKCSGWVEVGELTSASRGARWRSTQWRHRPDGVNTVSQPAGCFSLPQSSNENDKCLCNPNTALAALWFQCYLKGSNVSHRPRIGAEQRIESENCGNPTRYSYYTSPLNVTAGSSFYYTKVWIIYWSSSHWKGNVLLLVKYIHWHQ